MSVMDSSGCEQAKPAVFGVVSGKDDPEIGLCFFQVLEATWVVRGIFDRLEVALRKWIVTCLPQAGLILEDG